ncbi:MAG: shikimate dehydrogenase [Acidobacteria bacterium ACB1]|nr:Shikimate dehydrogenase (NADP(+)) [Pyrinomonadaceae bacterium]MCE7962081.1 shikimate dehydrogenase [Acidobacteria bacterium ACB1]RIJ95438.1 MAG: shikimate dehydrogenase [Acidobacteriota bacterium]
MNVASKICVAIAPKRLSDLEPLFREASAVEPGFIEIRFDAMEPSELAAAVKKASEFTQLCRLIATFRPKGEGGFRAISDDERRDFWAALSEGFWGCDVESDAVSWVEHKNKIVSRHDFEGMPASLEGLFAELTEFECKAVKIAVTADDAVSTIPVWKTLLTESKGDRDAILIAMGEAGKWTRILGPSRGSLLTYASLDAGAATASGQVSAMEMRDLYRVDELNKDTRIYGVIGDPIGQSLSPNIHNPLFANAGLNAVFLPFLVKDLRGFIDGFVRLGTEQCGLNFDGLSVTMPHKVSIIEMLDEIDETAARAGAVNTVSSVGGKLIGYNTDAAGFLLPLKARVPDLNGVRAAILGAGGAARACLSALSNEGADSTVFARDESAGRALSAAFSCDFAKLCEGNDLSAFDVIVNATPIGMRGEFEHLSPVPEASLHAGQVVFDLVTSPAETLFLAAARNAGAEVIPGVEMLIAQGLRQFEIWTGTVGDEQVVRASLAAKMAS